jgi:hypothetical protein
MNSSEVNEEQAALLDMPSSIEYKVVLWSTSEDVLAPYTTNPV